MKNKSRKDPSGLDHLATWVDRLISIGFGLGVMTLIFLFIYVLITQFLTKTQ